MELRVSISVLFEGDFLLNAAKDRNFVIFELGVGGVEVLYENESNPLLVPCSCGHRLCYRKEGDRLCSWCGWRF